MEAQELRFFVIVFLSYEEKTKWEKDGLAPVMVTDILAQLHIYSFLCESMQG